MAGRRGNSCISLPVSTVGAVLRRHGLGRLSGLEPKAPVLRYERQRPGVLLHIDSKMLARIDGLGHRITGDRTSRTRGVGWEYLHVAVDDASHLAYTEILPAETGLLGPECADSLNPPGSLFGGQAMRRGAGLTLILY